MNNFQRVGSISNAHVGRELEEIAATYLAAQGVHVHPRHKVLVGVAGIKRPHEFDLGCDEQMIIVECKAHTWTSGDKVPSAKMINWAEAMFYFSLTPAYRKIFFVQRSVRTATGESLVDYFKRTKPHLIPLGVEFWEYDFETKAVLISGLPNTQGST